MDSTDHGRAKNLKLTTTLINTGDDRLTLVNDPSSVLSEHAQFQKFIVASTSEDRENPRFKGLRLTFSPEIAAERGNVTSLDAGLSASLTRTHDCEDKLLFPLCNTDMSQCPEYTRSPLENTALSLGVYSTPSIQRHMSFSPSRQK